MSEPDLGHLSFKSTQKCWFWRNQPRKSAQMQKQLPPTPHQPSIPPPLQQPVEVKLYFSTNQRKC